MSLLGPELESPILGRQVRWLGQAALSRRARWRAVDAQAMSPFGCCAGLGKRFRARAQTIAPGCAWAADCAPALNANDRVPQPPKAPPPKTEGSAARRSPRSPRS